MPAKRPLWRRIVRGIAITVGVLIGLVALAIGFVHTSWGKSLVRSRIESKLAARVNGEIRIGTLDYNFMFGEIRIGDVEIKDAAGTRVIGIGSIRVGVDRRSILDGAPVIDELAIDGLDLRVAQAAGGGTNLKGLFKPSGKSSFERIRVTHVAIAGAGSMRKLDGTVYELSDLHVTGAIDARTAIKQLDAQLSGAGAKLAIQSPDRPKRNFDISLASVSIARHAGGIDLGLHKLAVGAIGVETIDAHVGLAEGALAGQQLITLTGARVDRTQLATLLGKDLLADDVLVDATISGPAEQLVIGGSVRTGRSSLKLDGAIDRSVPARPSYRLSVIGDRLHSKLVKARESKVELADTDVRIELTGSGAVLSEIEAAVSVAIGPTMVDKVAVDGIIAHATAHRGAFQLDQFEVTALGMAVTATGSLDAARAVHGAVNVKGDPENLAKGLAAAGIKVPGNIALPRTLDLSVLADGSLDGVLAVKIQPTRLAVAGGQISVTGAAQLDRRLLQSATAHVELIGLDLGALARLAGRKPKVFGSLSGTIDLARDGATKRAGYDLTITPRGAGIVLSAKGSADPTSVLANVTATRTSDRVAIGTLAAQIPLAKRNGKVGLQPEGAWKVELDVAQRSLAEIRELVPERLRARIPAGNVELHVALAGTPARPTGTITLASTAAVLRNSSAALDLRATIASSDVGLAVTTTGSVALDAMNPVATIAGTLALPAPFQAGRLDVQAMRAGATFAGEIAIPERELASLAFLRPALAKIDGTIGGTIKVTGPLEVPALDAELAWRGYRVATGAAGSTVVNARGTLTAFDLRIDHGGALAITAAVQRSADRIEIAAKVTGDGALLPLVPAFAISKTSADPGKLHCDLQGQFSLARGPKGLALDTVALTGTLDLAGGMFPVPGSTRVFRDIGLTVVGEPNGLRIQRLALHESDAENSDRRVEASGLLTWDKLKPQKLSLSIAAHDWLLFGPTLLGPSDAPRAAADFTIGAEVDFTAPILAIDATVKSLELRAPDRFDRAHQPELPALATDIIYVGATSASVGKLPFAPVEVAAAPRPRRPIDVRIRIPSAIHVVQTPFDLHATGEVTMAIRDTGRVIRGGLQMERGTLNLFGREHQLVKGSFQFTDEHPTGWMDLTFERRLTPAVLRGVSRASSGSVSRVMFAGTPTKPKISLGGATNGSMGDTMSMHNAGGPMFVGAPDMPASSTVNAPRGDQLGVLTFMATNLSHLLFLDRASAWADPYATPAAYGRIQNVEAERALGRSRIRAVTRPHTPGRSTAEIHYDRMLVDTEGAAVGVGLRAGSRVGGGIGVFVEWSSSD